MSHRLPPEDRDTFPKFALLMVVLLGVLFGVWLIVLGVLT